MWLALLDAGIHFIMDRVKASPNLLGRWKALSGAEMRNILSYEHTIVLGKFKSELRGNVLFWWSLGFDQMVHHLTHYSLIYLMLRAMGIVP